MVMRKFALLAPLIAAAILLAILVVYLVHPSLIPGSHSAEAASGNVLVELGTYSGWRGVEAMVTPLDEYIRSIRGASVFFTADLIWPYADSKNPFRDLLTDRGVGVALVTILSVDRVERRDIYAYVVYKARIDRVIVKPQNNVELPPEKVCTKDPELCDLGRRQREIIDNLISMIESSNVIELKVAAFIARESIGKTNLSISDVATPFPLPEPGYQYLVFLDPELDGIRIHYDYVWGPWAYLVLDGRVYSLNYVKPPANVSLDPAKLFKSPYIYWESYPYEQLRNAAIQKLSVNGEQLENFINKILKG